MVRHGINGQMDSTIGRNMFNCSLRYYTNLVDILNMQFHSRDIYSYVSANTDIYDLFFMYL
jgi:hypothetical protein